MEALLQVTIKIKSTYSFHDNIGHSLCSCLYKNELIYCLWLYCCHMILCIFIYHVITGGSRLQTDRGFQCPDTVRARKAHWSEDGDAFLRRQVVADWGGTHGAVAGGRPSVHHGGQDEWFRKVWGNVNGSTAKFYIRDVKQLIFLIIRGTNGVRTRCKLHLSGLAEVGPSQELKHQVNTPCAFCRFWWKWSDPHPRNKGTEAVIALMVAINRAFITVLAINQHAH